MQQIQLIGHLGQDAEVKEHQGRKFVTFTVAVTDKYKDQSGNEVKRVTWYSCTFDNTNVSNYLTKGTQVFIQGTPRQEVYYSEAHRQWQGKIKVAAHKLQLLGSPAEKSAVNDLPPVASQPTPAQPQREPVAAGEESNDLPF